MIKEYPFPSRLAAGSHPSFVFKDFPLTHAVCTAPGGKSFDAPSGFALGPIIAAGQANGPFNLAEIVRDIGRGGRFDFQRSVNSVGDTTFYRGFQPVANIAVGAYMYGAKYTRAGTTALGTIYAHLGSSNAGAKSQIENWKAGHDMAANGGKLSCH